MVREERVLGVVVSILIITEEVLHRVAFLLGWRFEVNNKLNPTRDTLSQFEMR